MCHRCVIFSNPVIKRSQLQTLTRSDLKFHTKRLHLQTSPTLSTDDLIEVILSKQVHLLVERTNEAIQQLSNVPPGTDLNNFDITLLSHTESTAYSTSGAGGSSIVNSERASDRMDGGATPLEEKLHIRKKVRKVCREGYIALLALCTLCGCLRCHISGPCPVTFFHFSYVYF